MSRVRSSSPAFCDRSSAVERLLPNENVEGSNPFGRFMKVEIPTALKPFANDNDFIEVGANTVSSMLRDIELNFPDLHNRIVTDGKMNRFINIYINSEDMRFLNGMDTKLADEDEVYIALAISGG